MSPRDGIITIHVLLLVLQDARVDRARNVDAPGILLPSVPHVVHFRGREVFTEVFKGHVGQGATRRCPRSAARKKLSEDTLDLLTSSPKFLFPKSAIDMLGIDSLAVLSSPLRDLLYNT